MQTRAQEKKQKLKKQKQEQRKRQEEESKRVMQLEELKIKAQFERHELQFKSIRSMLSLPANYPLHSKLIKFWRQQILAAEYIRVFKLGLQIVNYSARGRAKLRTIWDYVGLKPQNAYAEYFIAPEVGLLFF